MAAPKLTACLKGEQEIYSTRRVLSSDFSSVDVRGTQLAEKSNQKRGGGPPTTYDFDCLSIVTDEIRSSAPAMIYGQRD